MKNGLKIELFSTCITAEVFTNAVTKRNAFKKAAADYVSSALPKAVDTKCA